MRLSPHQQAGYCPLCDDDATRHHHCSWCGETFDDAAMLEAHLDETNCAVLMAAAVDGEPIGDADKMQYTAEVIVYSRLQMALSIVVATTEMALGDTRPALAAAIEPFLAQAQVALEAALKLQREAP